MAHLGTSTHRASSGNFIFFFYYLSFIIWVLVSIFWFRTVVFKIGGSPDDKLVYLSTFSYHSLPLTISSLFLVSETQWVKYRMLGEGILSTPSAYLWLYISFSLSSPFYHHSEWCCFIFRERAGAPRRIKNQETGPIHHDHVFLILKFKK